MPAFTAIMRSPIATVFVLLALVSACQHPTNGEESTSSQTQESTPPPVTSASTASPALVVDASKVMFSPVVDKKITVSATSDFLAGTESFTATISVVRAGKEMIPAGSEDIGKYCAYRSALELYLQGVKAGDLVTLHFVGISSAKTYDVNATLSDATTVEDSTSSSTNTSSDSSSSATTTSSSSSSSTETSSSGTSSSADNPSNTSSQSDSSTDTATDSTEDTPVDVGGTEATTTTSSTVAPNCANAITGAWSNGSCTGTPLALASGGGSDPLDDLTGHCTTGDSTCTTLGGGWEYATPGWHICDPGPCERWENIKWETVEGNDGGAYQGSRYHIFAAREQSTEALKTFADRKAGYRYSLPDDNARQIFRTFTQVLSPGTYKLALDLWCEMIAEDGTAHGSCEDPSYGSYAQSGAPLFVKIDCTAYADGSSGTIAQIGLPPYPSKTRFEREFAVGKTCNSFALRLHGYNDVDTYEYMYADASQTTNSATRTTSDFRSTLVDNLSIAPLAIGSSSQIDETAKGLADYFRVVSHCYSTSTVGCEKVFYKTDGTRYQGSGTIDIYNSKNDVTLVPGPTPSLVRTETLTSTETRTFYEIGHNPSPSIAAEPVTDHSYFFISKRPEEVAPWTVPSQAMVNTAKNAVSLYQTSDDDTLRTWISVRNPTMGDLSPSFDIPSAWTLYALVQLPTVMNTKDGSPAFEIFPDHLVKCSVASQTDSTQTVQCNTPSDWPIPAQSSRSYLVEIPPLNLSSGTSTTKTLALSGASDSLSITVTGLTAATDPSHIVMWNTNPYAIWDTADTIADWKRHHVGDALLYENGLCTMGYCSTFDEVGANQDLNGDGIKSATLYYLPLKKVTLCGDTEVTAGSNCSNNIQAVDNCVPSTETVSYLGSSLQVQGLVSAASAQGITLGLSMGPYNLWSWGFQGTDSDGDGSVDTATEYKKAQFAQKGNVDLDHNYSADWNAVVFDGTEVSATGSSIASYASNFAAGDYVAWKTKFDAGGPLARIKDVVLDTTANTLTLYLDIPFFSVPGTTGSLYKLYRSGLLNAGIQVATRSGGACESLRGHADGEPLREINFPRAPTINWTLNSDGTITSSCTAYDGTGNCKLNPRPTDVQTALVKEIIADYTSVLTSTFGDSASKHIVQFASSYDETWGFTNLNLNFFGGLGQSELVGVADLFERNGLRTSNTNRAPYFAMEKNYRDFDSAVEGMSFPGLTGVLPTASPYAASLFDYYFDPSHSEGGTTSANQGLLYSGGYGTVLPFYQRYQIGLARMRADEAQSSAPITGNLIWGYLIEDSSPEDNDPAYLSGSDFVSATARYVAERDYLAWGTDKRASRYGLWRAPLSSDHTTNRTDTALYASGSETIEWSGVLEGDHLFRVAKALAQNATTISLDALPWQTTEDFHFSLCALTTAINNSQSLSAQANPEQALSCLCEDYVNDSACSTSQ